MRVHLRRYKSTHGPHYTLVHASTVTHSRSPQRPAETIAIETHVHLRSDHVDAAQAAGWQLAEMHEQLVDDRWVRTKATWTTYRDCPISFAFVWRRD